MGGLEASRLRGFEALPLPTPRPRAGANGDSAIHRAAKDGEAYAPTLPPSRTAPFHLRLEIPLGSRRWPASPAARRPPTAERESHPWEVRCTSRNYPLTPSGLGFVPGRPRTTTPVTPGDCDLRHHWPLPRKARRARPGTTTPMTHRDYDLRPHWSSERGARRDM